MSYLILNNSSSQELKSEQQISSLGRRPLLLLGSDSNPVLIRQALGSQLEWELPLLKGILEGARCVWASKLGKGGAPAATLIRGGKCTVIVAWPEAAQLQALCQAAGNDFRLAQLSDCVISDGKQQFDSLLALIADPLSLDGDACQVASASVDLTHQQEMFMIQLSDWLCQKARINGLEIYTPADLQKAWLNPSQRPKVEEIMKPLDSGLLLKDPAAW